MRAESDLSRFRHEQRGAYKMTGADRITIDPVVTGGKPCIRRMRVTVGAILGLLAAGKSEEEILNTHLGGYENVESENDGGESSCLHRLIGSP